MQESGALRALEPSLSMQTLPDTVYMKEYLVPRAGLEDTAQRPLPLRESNPQS
jgi:hypothetical protein